MKFGFLLSSILHNGAANERKENTALRSREKAAPVRPSVHRYLTRGWRKYVLRGAITAAKVLRRGSARAALSSLYTHGYNILMKERPDRAKCPRRLALPNCSVPRPSGGFHPSPGSEHAPIPPTYYPTASISAGCSLPPLRELRAPEVYTR